jgi:hypothetical protein
MASEARAGEPTTPPTEGSEGPAAPAAALLDAFALRGGSEQAPDHPLRDAKPANDGNLYPYNSKLRPPPLWIDEDGVEIADQPKVVYSDPHYWPYTAKRPPPFVAPQPQTDTPPREDNGRNGAW